MSGSIPSNPATAKYLFAVIAAIERRGEFHATPFVGISPVGPVEVSWVIHNEPIDLRGLITVNHSWNSDRIVLYWFTSDLIPVRAVDIRPHMYLDPAVTVEPLVSTFFSLRHLTQEPQ